MNEDNGYIYWMGLAMQHYADMGVERMRWMDEQITELETISGLSVDNIIDLFKKGYRLEKPDDASGKFKMQMKDIALIQEKDMRREEKELRRRISGMLFGGKRK